MVREEKYDALKYLEYQTKLMEFRLKYARSIPEIIILTIQLGMTINNFRIVQSQPLPRFSKGGVLVGENNQPELIIINDLKGN